MSEVGATRTQLIRAAQLLLFTAFLDAISSSTATAQPLPRKCQGEELEWRVRSPPGEVSATLVIAEHAEPRWLTLCRGYEPGIGVGLRVEVLYVLKEKEGGHLYRQRLDIDQCISVDAMSVEVAATKQGDHIQDEADVGGHWCE